MTVVMEMSTDTDIRATAVDFTWNPGNRLNWGALSAGGAGIANGETIVVIAHGDAAEIGNHNPGLVDVTPARFIQLIRANMAAGANPTGGIYISVCQVNLANFAAAVRLLMDAQGGWDGVVVYGHRDPTAGAVPPRTDNGWNAMVPAGMRLRRA
jgi:hypothetical protein